MHRIWFRIVLGTGCREISFGSRSRFGHAEAGLTERSRLISHGEREGMDKELAIQGTI